MYNRWLWKKDILAYVIRQAQSCDYLENYFNSDLRGKLDKDGQELLDKLISCHRRQKNDIELIMGVKVPERNGGSYYFDNMRKGNDKPMFLLALQYVSYVRGEKRYALLIEHESRENLPFINMWKRFHMDAKRNADLVLEYMIERWNIKPFPILIKLLIREQILIWKINRYNGTN